MRSTVGPRERTVLCAQLVTPPAPCDTIQVDCFRHRTVAVLSSPRPLPVLDFQRGPKPRNFLSRREQWRLLVLVLMLGLVVIFAWEARNPDYYRWLWAQAENEEAPGTFRSPAPVAPEETAPSRYFPGVEPSRLKSIRDNKPLGLSEWNAWLHLFDVLRKNEEATLEQASTGRVSFVQLFEQSGEYRAELVTTGGIVRRAHPAKTPKNEYGLSDYYQVWLWPADHPNDPIAVWCLHLPKGFPIGMTMAEEAEVTGFYFKLWAYKAADGKVLRAPMLLARTVRWRKKPEVARAPPQGPLPLALMIAGAAAFAVLATVYVFYRTGNQGLARVESLPGRSTLQDADSSPDVGATLQQLADSEDAEGYHE